MTTASASSNDSSRIRDAVLTQLLQKDRRGDEQGRLGKTRVAKPRFRCGPSGPRIEQERCHVGTAGRATHRRGASGEIADQGIGGEAGEHARILRPLSGKQQTDVAGQRRQRWIDEFGGIDQRGSRAIRRG